MRRAFVMGLLAGFLLCANGVAEEDEVWFDIKNCSICKHMAPHEAIVDEMKWEVHLIDNGMLSIAVIPAKHKKAMEEAHKSMEGTIAKLEAGESLPLCGYCNSYGELMYAGVKQQDFESSIGMVNLLTSDDPEVVKKIHAHAKRAKQEHEKLEKARKGK